MQSKPNATINSAGVAIVGGGPAGLMAAEIISAAGYSVAVYDAMPSVGRKFLLAGVGGMNITHAEPLQKFLARYTAAQSDLTPIIQAFDASALRAWATGLGVETFVGSSQRVFPKEMKAAPLLRAWLHRLRAQGVTFYPRHRWLGWSDGGALRFSTRNHANDTAQEKLISADVCVLALGGGSWARLGSDGAWMPLLRAQQISVAELQPSNCGFEFSISEFFSTCFAGEPLKTVALTTTDIYGTVHHLRGECTISRYGIEGSAVYALSAPLREQLKHAGKAQLNVDLLPDRTPENVIAQLDLPRGKDTLSNFLRKKLKLTPVKIALLKELLPREIWHDSLRLAKAIKSLPIILTGVRPLDEAISSAGGICFSALDQHLMLHQLPGVFCAGEMLDWEAPTGGYLLTACLATGRTAGAGVVAWLQQQTEIKVFE